MLSAEHEGNIQSQLTKVLQSTRKSSILVNGTSLEGRHKATSQGHMKRGILWGGKGEMLKFTLRARSMAGREHRTERIKLAIDVLCVTLGVKRVSRLLAKSKVGTAQRSWRRLCQ